MKTSLLIGLLASATLATSAAAADDKAACLSASQQAQTLRDAHKLVEAREQLRACARKQCPAVVQKDCVAWLGEIERSLPTVVVTAKDQAGADLADVKVTVDGSPLVDKLDGSAVPMNPGMHTFHFASSDGTTLDQQVLIKEGQTNQGVAVILKKPPPTVPPPVTPPPVSPAPVPPSDATGSSTWKTVGWVLGAAGLVGLGIGTVFGVVALSDKNSANCDANKLCDAGPLSGARSAATVADIGLIAGGCCSPEERHSC